MIAAVMSVSAFNWFGFTSTSMCQWDVLRPRYMSMGPQWPLCVLPWSCGRKRTACRCELQERKKLKPEPSNQIDFTLSSCVSGVGQNCSHSSRNALGFTRRRRVDVPCVYLCVYGHWGRNVGCVVCGRTLHVGAVRRWHSPLVLRCHSTCQTEINPAVVPVNLRVLTEQSGISG